MVLTAAYVGSQGRNLFLRSVSNRILPGQTVIANGSTLPTGIGVINRTNAGGQVVADHTVREFSIVSGTSVRANPFAEMTTNKRWSRQLQELCRCRSLAASAAD